MKPRDTRSPSGDLGALLRHWRDRRGRSQLDLSMESGVSQRHISFIESGRSVPSRQTLHILAEALDVPLRERNALLLAAGYASLHPETAWDAPAMRSVESALRRMLRQHEPFPAVVMDRDWTVLQANDAAPRFFNRFFNMAAREGPRNILHLMFDPAGMRPFIVNWEAAARGLFARVHRESIGHVADAGTEALVEALLAYPDVEPAWKHAGPSGDLPVIPLSFAWQGEVLNYFSMVTTVGTPLTLAAQELRLESMFPADEATETRHLALMGDAPVHRPDP